MIDQKYYNELLWINDKTTTKLLIANCVTQQYYNYIIIEVFIKTGR